MKAIGIVGFKKSGKTTLAISIGNCLMKKGYSVAVIKHSNEAIEHGNTDTGKFMKEISQVALVTPRNSEIIFKGAKDLREVISYFQVDFLIIEGFKLARYFPKIVCLNKENEAKELDDGLTLLTAGLNGSLKEKKVIEFLISNEIDRKEIVNRIEEKAFILPDMNCGKCGYEHCYDLAQAIVKGSASSDQCIYFQKVISIHVNQKRVVLNPFMSKLYQNMIYGMFSPLKDIDSLENAQIEIKLPSAIKIKRK